MSGAARCQCAASRIVANILSRAGIPPNYEHASFENFRIPSRSENPIEADALARAYLEVKGFAREFPAVEKPGLLLTGNPGTGKTHLAVAALKVLIDKGHEAVFWDYQRLLDSIRASYDPASGVSDREAYQEAMECEILLLDDLGAHRVTEWVEDTVTAIITHRCNHRKPLIATTNLPDQEMGTRTSNAYQHTLGDKIGMRARSRLFEMCRIVRLPVADHRIGPAR